MILVDFSTEWCPPCNAMSDWLAGNSDDYESYYPGVRDAINNDEVTWVTILTQQNDGSPASKKTCKDWDNAYPNEHIPVLAGGPDEEASINLSYFPRHLVGRRHAHRRHTRRRLRVSARSLIVHRVTG